MFSRYIFDPERRVGIGLCRSFEDVPRVCADILQGIGRSIGRKVLLFAATCFFIMLPLARVHAGAVQEAESRETSPTEEAHAEAVLPSAIEDSETPNNSQSYPLSIVDGLGNTVVLESRPDRIASLTLFTDELLFDLVDVERLAAITNLASDAVYSNVADRASEVEVQIDLNVEVLISLAPDLIFLANWSSASKVEQLRRAGLRTYIVNTPLTIPAIQSEILTIARILGEAEAGEEIVQGMNERLSRLSEALAPLAPQEQLSAVDYNSWGTSSSAGSTWNSILQAASVQNAVADYVADEFGQTPLSKELLVELDPNVLFLPGWIWGDPDGAAAFEQEVRSDPALAGLSAINANRVYLLPERLKSTYSQYIVDSVWAVAELVYPQYFE